MKYIQFLFFFILNSIIFGQEMLVDKVVAKVGSEPILLSEVEEEFSYAKTKDPTLSDKIKCVILDNIIAQKLLVYQAKIDSVDVTDEEVETQLNYRFESILKQMNGDEAFFQEYYNASIDEMKDRFREDQKHKILADRMQYNLMTDIEITPREVEKFFNSIPADSLPYFKSEMEISELVILPKVNDTEKKKAFDKITNLREQVVSGQATFENIASKYSQDGSSLRGGDLGFAKRGVFVPEFEATVFGLNGNEISEVIETEFGFHFIQLIERRGNAIRARHVLIKPEITQNDLDLAKHKLDSIRLLIISDSLQFETAVKRFSLKSLPSYANNGRVKNENSNNTFFAADDLDPDTYFAVYQLKTGEISNPIEITLPDGNKGFRIIKLQSISKPHKANLKQDFDKITLYAKENKKNEYFLKWLKEKRAETFIQIDKMFNQCDLVTP